MLKFLLLILAGYGLMCLLLFVNQRNMLYFPTAEAKRFDANEIWLGSDAARLKIWQINQGREAIIYFGGNAESVELNAAMFKSLFADKTIYLVNYRGYGGSSGKPSEAALLTDALAIYDRVAAQHSRLHVIGRSLGSGVALYLAAHRQVGRIVLITPYDSIESVARAHYPLFPVRWLLRDRFDSLAWAPRLDNQILLLAGGRDRIIPSTHAASLQRHLSAAQSDLVIIEQASHNDILEFRSAREKMSVFMKGGDTE